MELQLLLSMLFDLLALMLGGQSSASSRPAKRLTEQELGKVSGRMLHRQ